VSALGGAAVTSVSRGIAGVMSGASGASGASARSLGVRLALGVYLVSDTAMAGRHGLGLAAVVDAAVAGGVTTVQLRDHDASAAELLATAVELATVIDGRALFLIDDRVDVALAARLAGARVDGVHLGQSDLPVAVARSLLGPDAVIGLTANTRAHLAAARALPPGTVDYLGVGVIRPTTTKPDHPEPLGIDGFGAFASAARGGRSPDDDLPCVAIGGIVEADVPALRGVGAAGVAVVSAICGAPDPRAAASRFAALWSGARGSAASESGVRESGASESGASESGASESGASESEVRESGASEGRAHANGAAR
jgi:thiamine-phosphate diphosphorylase